MAKRDETTAAKIARGVVAGLIAGAVASFAMDRFQAAAAALSSDDEGGDSEPATEKAADAIADATMGRAVPTADKPLAGQAIHYVLGIGLGVAYGVAAEFAPGATAGYGAAFGVVTATVLDEGVVPAVGLGEAPWASSPGTLLYGYASHLVFGATAELVRRQVAATLSD